MFVAFDGLGRGIGHVLVGVEVISSSNMVIDCSCNSMELMVMCVDV